MTDAVYLGRAGRPPLLILLGVTREDGRISAEAHIVRTDLPAGLLEILSTGETVTIPALRRGVHIHSELHLEIP